MAEASGEVFEKFVDGFVFEKGRFLIEDFLLKLVLPEGDGVFELLGQVFVDRFSALEDGSTIFETFYLL